MRGLCSTTVGLVIFRHTSGGDKDNTPCNSHNISEGAFLHVSIAKRMTLLEPRLERTAIVPPEPDVCTTLDICLKSEDNILKGICETFVPWGIRPTFDFLNQLRQIAVDCY